MPNAKYEGWPKLALSALVLAGAAAMACVDPQQFGTTANNIFLLAAGYMFHQVTERPK